MGVNIEFLSHAMFGVLYIVHTLSELSYEVFLTKNHYV